MAIDYIEKEQPPNEVGERYDFMLEFLHEAGEHALRAFAQNYELEVVVKPDGSKVTNIDHEVNQMFIDEIRSYFDRDVVRGEEAIYVPEGADGESNWIWVIDPIDGTSGFARNARNKTPETCTSAIMIAAFEPGSDQPVMAGVYSPFGQNELYACNDWSSYFHDGGIPPKHPNFNRTFDEPIVYDIDPWDGALPDIRQIAEHLHLDSRQEKISSIGISAGRVATGAIDLSVFPGPRSNVHDYVPALYIAASGFGTWATNLNGDTPAKINMLQPTNGLLLAGSRKVGESVMKIVRDLQFTT